VSSPEPCAPRIAELAGELLGEGAFDDPCSFSGETMVLTDRGEVPIAEVRQDDQVWASDPATGSEGWRAVTHVSKHVDREAEILQIDDVEVATTPAHPFFVVGRGWVEAGHLEEGDLVRRANGGVGRVGGVSLLSDSFEAYSLSVQGLH